MNEALGNYFGKDDKDIDLLEDMAVNHVFNGVITDQEILEHLKLGEDCLLQHEEDDLRPCLGPIAATRPGHMELIINTVERVSGLGAAVSEESSAGGPYAAGGPDCCVVRASGLADGVNCDDGLNVKCADPDQEVSITQMGKVVSHGSFVDPRPSHKQVEECSRLDAAVEKSARVPVEEGSSS
ncbi:putative fibroblast growth factor-binding protein 2 [Sesbania bispinosa]|nr:putative fibroblast growth factor-binding protein 2 [Sesbania bispinosa]